MYLVTPLDGCPFGCTANIHGDLVYAVVTTNTFALCARIRCCAHVGVSWEPVVLVPLHGQWSTACPAYESLQQQDDDAVLNFEIHPFMSTGCTGEFAWWWC